MKKIKKILILIPIISILISMCFTVSAESSFEALPITVTKIWSNNVDNNTYTQDAENYVTVTIPYHASKSQFASIWQFNNSDNSNYYDYKFQFVFTIVEPKDFTCTLNGKSYEVKKDATLVNTYYVEMDQVKLNTTQGRLDYSFTWSANTTGYMYVIAYYRLSDVNAILDNQNENTDKIIENQNSNTDKEIQADKENTQAIIDNQNQLAEQEKQDIESSKNDSVDGATEAMPDSEGFGDIFDKFVQCIDHTSTTATLDIPEIYIPAISNILPKTVLYKGGKADFNQVVDMIPTTILTLIQALCTLALIVFAFKELWELISDFLSGGFVSNELKATDDIMSDYMMGRMKE